MPIGTAATGTQQASAQGQDGTGLNGQETRVRSRVAALEERFGDPHDESNQLSYATPRPGRRGR